MTRLPLIVLTLVLVLSAMPYLLSLVGVGYGPAAKGGAGAHFAGYLAGDHLIRMDVAAAGLLFFFSALCFIYFRVSPSRYVSIMSASLIMGGLALAVQVVPDQMGHSHAGLFPEQAVLSTTLGYLGLAVLLLNGHFFLRFGLRGSTRLTLGPVLTSGLILLSGTWILMAANWAFVHDNLGKIQLLTIGLFLVDGILLKPKLNPKVLRFFKLGLTGMLISQISGMIWLYSSTSNIFDQGFHIATLLWWMALLMPVLGLGIDFINVYYSKGMAGEKRFLRKVVDTIPHFIFSRDEQGTFTLVNKAVADFYGMTTHQVEGRHLSEIHIDREQKDQWLEEDREILAHGQTTTLPTAMTRDSEGNPIWIDAIKSPLKGRGIQNQVLGISIDITAQKNAEDALAQRLNFEQTATQILRHFIKCTVENFDQSMSRILLALGNFYRADACFIYRVEPDLRDGHLLHSWQKDVVRLDRTLPRLLPAEDISWLLPEMQRGKPAIYHRASDLPRAAGAFAAALGCTGDQGLVLAPVFSQDRLFGFFGLETTRNQEWTKDESYLLRNAIDLFMTVWEKLEIEKDLTRAMTEAQASSRAKSEFLANMSHEIRTPMNCVIGISELLREMDPTEGQRQYLEMISQSGESLLALINDILDLSKIEAGQLQLDPVETNLRCLVEDAVGLVAFNAQAKGLEMVCRYAPGAPDMVVCDPNRLRQVLTNLLNNAFKFTKEGHLYLNVEPVGKRDGKLEMQFQLTDTGIGIPAQKLEKIFDKFTQADTSTTRRFGGTGLGLSICKQLVKLMGGEISADSEAGGGSTFRFTVPVEEVPGSLQAPERVAQPDARLLVISNHELGCEVLAEQVRHLGYECATALSTQEGVAMLDEMVTAGEKPFAFILVDQDVLTAQTPVFKQFLECVPLAERPKLVLLTSLSSIIREADLLRDGFISTLTKPVRPGRLAEVLNGTRGVDQAIGAPTPEAQTSGQPEAELPSAPVSRTEDQPNILLAEDNPFNQKVALGMLKLLGCRVQIANNGAEALAMVREESFDVVFMDCQMPEMDGYEATRQIRSLPGSAGKTTIIAMTANALSGDRTACFDVGMDDFLSKPITKAMLADMLAKWELLPQAVTQK